MYKFLFRSRYISSHDPTYERRFKECFTQNVRRRRDAKTRDERSGRAFDSRDRARSRQTSFQVRTERHDLRLAAHS